MRMGTPGFTIGILLIILGSLGISLPPHELSEHFNNHNYGWFLVALGIFCVLFGAWAVYQSTHSAHTERIDNNSRPGASVFDNSQRY